MAGSDRFDAGLLTLGLGDDWYVRYGSIKRYPACSPGHPLIDAALRLVDERRISADAIESIEVDHQPAAKQSAKVLGMLPKAAEAARREIAEALACNSRASLKARVTLREAYSGRIELVPDEARGLVAHWNIQTAALLQRVGTGGSG